MSRFFLVVGFSDSIDKTVVALNERVTFFIYIYIYMTSYMHYSRCADPTEWRSSRMTFVQFVVALSLQTKEDTVWKKKCLFSRDDPVRSEIRSLQILAIQPCSFFRWLTRLNFIGMMLWQKGHVYKTRPHSSRTCRFRAILDLYVFLHSQHVWKPERKEERYL